MMRAQTHSAFHMADIRYKRLTRRRAVAVGELNAGPSAYPWIVERRLPKGDALTMAEIAGVQGAKSASALMPLCHPLTLDLVRIHIAPKPKRHAIRIWCECASEARTGVEMEALAGVNAALLTVYDLTKPIEPALHIGGIRLLFKEGGKSGLWLHPQGMDVEERTLFRPYAASELRGVPCAVLTLSDRASSGNYVDESGPCIAKALNALGGDVVDNAILPDGIEPLAARLRQLASHGVRLCLCTGGTGLGERDLTPEALASLGGRPVPGLAEMLRGISAQHTPLAWLSRASAIQLDRTLIIALPGSPRAATQCMDILAPVLGHALAMMDGSDHP